MKYYKMAYIDHGFCRINYFRKTEDGKTFYLCLQDEGSGYGGVTLYTCSEDYEPIRSVKPIDCIHFEYPTGESLIEKEVKKYLLKHDPMRVKKENLKKKIMEAIMVGPMSELEKRLDKVLEEEL